MRFFIDDIILQKVNIGLIKAAGTFRHTVSLTFRRTFNLRSNRPSTTAGRPRRLLALKLPLLIVIALLASGCGLNQIKQREAALNEQQQALLEQQNAILEQQNALLEQQQQLQLEDDRLSVLKETLSEEEKRLQALKKSLEPAIKNYRKPVTPAPQITIGELEHVFLSPPDIELTARIDTGANTSSLNALDMVKFERDGTAHVRFHILDPRSGKKIEIIRPIIRHVKIKEHDGEAQSRPIIKMRVRLGHLDQSIKMTLTDRSEFKHQVLIGRNFLRDYVIVDVSQKFKTKPVINDE